MNIKGICKQLKGRLIRKGLRILDFNYKDGDIYGNLETTLGRFQILSYIFLEAEDEEDAANSIVEDARETDSEMNNPYYRGR